MPADHSAPAMPPSAKSSAAWTSYARSTPRQPAANHSRHPSASSRSHASAERAGPRRLYAKDARCELSSPAHVELGARIRNMDLDRALAQEQHLRDFSVASPL